MRILSKIGATSAALTIVAIAGFVIYIIDHDEIEKAIYAIQHP
jgi:hypothetical protein